MVGPRLSSACQCAFTLHHAGRPNLIAEVGVFRPWNSQRGVGRPRRFWSGSRWHDSSEHRTVPSAETPRAGKHKSWLRRAISAEPSRSSGLLVGLAFGRWARALAVRDCRGHKPLGRADRKHESTGPGRRATVSHSTFTAARDAGSTIGNWVPSGRMMADGDMASAQPRQCDRNRSQRQRSGPELTRRWQVRRRPARGAADRRRTRPLGRPGGSGAQGPFRVVVYGVCHPLIM
jgi:hypothetical protein